VPSPLSLPEDVEEDAAAIVGADGVVRVRTVLEAAELFRVLTATGGPRGTIRSLDLEGVPIGDAGAALIAAQLKRRDGSPLPSPAPLADLVSLRLVQCGVGMRGVQELAGALKDHPSITSLDLSHSRVGLLGSRALCDALKSTSRLQELRLVDTALVGADMAVIAMGIAASASLRTVDLSDNFYIFDAGIEELAAQLRGKSAPALQALAVANCSVSCEGALALSDLASRLVALDLSRNVIGDAGARSVVDAVKRPNSRLAELDISENKLGAESVLAILQAAVARAKVGGGGSSMTAVNVGGHAVRDVACLVAAEAAKHLTRIGLARIGFTNEGTRLFAQALAGCTLATEVDLSENDQIGGAEKEFLVSAVPSMAFRF